MSVYPNVATGDLTTSIISSLYNRARAASMLAAKSKKEAYKRFKKAGLSDKQAQDAVDHYNFGGAAFKSRFGGDRLRRTRGFFGSRRPQDDITVSEQERVLRGMGLFARKRRGSSGGVDPETGESTGTGGGSGGDGPLGSDAAALPEGKDPDSFIPMQGLLPPPGNNLEEALKGVGRDGQYLTKEQRIEIFKKNKISRDVDNIFDKSSKTSSTPSPSPQTAAIQKVGSGDLVSSAIEKVFEDKNKELVEVIKDTADKVEDNQEILEKIERNTSFIEKLFDLQKEAIQDAKIAAEEADIDKTEDTAGFAGYKKLTDAMGGRGGGGGGVLGNILDFGGDLLDLVGGRYTRRGPNVARRRGARRRLAGQKAKGFLGRQKERFFGRKQKSPIGTRNQSKFVNNRLYQTKVSQFAPTKKNLLQKGLQKTKIAGKKIGKKLIGKTAQKAGTKAIAKGVGKGVGKALLKKIPILGLGVGALFAAQRAMAGDFVGAGLELASGAASTVPGFGTAASVGIDAALMAKDMHDASQMEQPEFERGGVSGPVVATLHGKEAVIPVKEGGFNNNPINKFFNKSEKTEKNIFSYLNAVNDNNDKVSAEMGTIVDGPDTGYDVALPNERQAIIPLDNKFTRGEPTVTQGGEYERGNVNLQVEEPKEEKQSLAEKKKIQKDLAESFRMGLDIYEKKTPGGFLGELGKKISDFLDKFGGGDSPDTSDGDAPEARVSGGGQGAGLKEGTDSATLATIAALESGSAQGQADVAQSVYNRMADGTYGDSITDILTRDGQYQVAFKDPTASSGAGTQVADVFKNIKDEDSAVKAIQYYYEKRGQSISEQEARKKFQDASRAISDPELQKKAAEHVGGRTEFLSAGSDTSRESNVAFRGSGSDNRFFSAYGSGNQMSRGAVAVPEGLFNEPEPPAGDDDKSGDKSGDTSSHPNQKITNNYGLKVGQERTFKASTGLNIKAHKTEKGFDFYQDGMFGRKLDFSDGKNQWVINEFIKSDGGRKPELLKPPEPAPEPPAPANTGAAKADQVKASSESAAAASKARTIAMAMPTAPAPAEVTTPSSPAASSSDLSSRPSDVAFTGISYQLNLNQLGATA